MKLQLITAGESRLAVVAMTDDGRSSEPLRNVVDIEAIQRLEEEGMKSYLLKVTVRVKKDRASSEDAPSAAGKRCLECGWGMKYIRNPDPVDVVTPWLCVCSNSHCRHHQGDE